jgi:hypothetical protein
LFFTKNAGPNWPFKHLGMKLSYILSLLFFC